MPFCTYFRLLTYGIYITLLKQLRKFQKRQSRWLCSTPSPAPSISEDHLSRLVTVQPEVVPLRPRLNVDQFGMTRGFVSS